MFGLWGWNSANLYAPGLVALLAGGTMVGFAPSAFPTWLRWTSAVLLALSVVIVAVMRAPGLATAPGMLWIVVASVILTVAPAKRLGGAGGGGRTLRQRGQ